MSDIAEDTWQFAGACDAPGRIRGRCVGHRVTIEAPPELVWDFVADFEGWTSWNPFYSATSGTAEEGGALRFTAHLAGMKPQRCKGRVLSVRQDELFEYEVRKMAGLIQALRFVELEELSPTRCRVANGEIMGGPAGRLVSRMVGEKVTQGLMDMNAALKAVSERKWRGRSA